MDLFDDFGMEWTSPGFEQQGEEDYLAPFRRRRLGYDDVPAMNTPGSAYDTYKGLLTEETEADKLLRQVQEGRPSLSDYNPSTLQKILAAVSGFSAGMKDPAAGVSKANEVLMDPYRRAHDLWKMDSEGKLAEARLAESAHARKLRGAQFGVTEERQRENLERLRLEDQEQARKNRAAESRQAQLDELNRKKAEAQMNKDAVLMRKYEAEIEKIKKGKDPKEPTAKDAASQLKAESQMFSSQAPKVLSTIREDPKIGQLLRDAGVGEEGIEYDEETGSINISGSGAPGVLQYIEKLIKEKIESSYPRYRKLSAFNFGEE